MRREEQGGETVRRIIVAGAIAATSILGVAVAASTVMSAPAVAAKHKAKPKPKKKGSAKVTANFSSCSVVTQAEAASAIGTSVTAGVLGNATVEGGLACVFYGPSAPTPTTPNVGQPDTVRVVVVTGSDALKWYNDYKSKVNAQPIAGYGNQAYYDGDASLSVLKGNYYLRVAVIPASAPPSLPDEEKLATAILPKL
jgi:lipopolysaccharide export system protein LptA